MAWFRLSSTLICFLIPVAAWADPFQFQVVDSSTGRGVPLVELTPAGSSALYTDSNGLIAIDDPSLLNRALTASARSYGYADWGGTLNLVSGGAQQITLDRFNKAERLYRVTGPNIYGDSVNAGLTAPLANPLHNANVKGQDSVQTAVYKNQIYWFWGDTLYEQGFGNFRASGARSDLPGQGGLDPSLGVNLNYFVNSSGSAREMMPLTDPGPVWIDGVFTVDDDAGNERLLAHYSRMNPDPTHLFEVLEHGLALFNDTSQTFQRFQVYPLDAPVVPRGHSFRQTIDGQDYIYFGEDYPDVRVKATLSDVMDLAKWQAFSPLAPNTRFDSANPALEKGPSGNIVFDWKSNTDPLASDMVNDLVQHGKMNRNDSPFRLKDHTTGRAVTLHRGSVQWNDYRHNWTLIGNEAFGDSFLGEVWFSEAPTPEGPWSDAVKVATHDGGANGDYDFYNPVAHPFFDQADGLFIYFEGTYSNTFLNTPATPVYDYNQIMYRLDLATIPPLTPLAGDYNGDHTVDGVDLLIWQRTLGANVAKYSGADGDGSAIIAAGDLAPWTLRFGVSQTEIGSVPVPEPAALTLALCAVSLLPSLRRLKRKARSTQQD
jgi:hypothetical protein